MLETYRQHISERAVEGVVPKPLDAPQTAQLVELIKKPPAGEEAFISDLLANRIPAGVDEAAYVKAGFLAAIAKGETISPILPAERATELLGTMLGGYNIAPLIDLLDSQNETICALAAKGLSHTLLIFDAFHDVQVKAKA
ncbi:MAG: aconitate hydratase B, partial [Methylococcales bacterium]|nr:aconitate hydratase B [Methylococcales bacterium]